MEVALLVGTRPQIIKSVPIIEEARERGVDIRVIHTGQHYDNLMSDVFFRSFRLPPAASNLGVGSGSQGYQVGEIIKRLDRLWERDKPDFVLVPGDTNSALATGIVAAKLRIRLGHIEAGARCYDMTMQEEMNRRVIDHLSGVLFAVSPHCQENLVREAVPGKVVLSGDTMFEVFMHSQDEIKRSSVLEDLELDAGDYFVLTLHREENTTDVGVILALFKDMASFGKKVVFPVHPRTRVLLKSHSIGLDERIMLVDPLDYFSMMRLVSSSVLVATDSGGLQKEAFWSQVPCITLRERTEWAETVSLNCNFIAPPGPRVALALKHVFAEYDSVKKSLHDSPNPYAVDRKRPSEIIMRGIL